MRRTALSMLFLIIAGCGALDERRYDTASLTESDQIYIARRGGECLGNCPTYDIYLFDDGRVVFRGVAHTAIVGTRTKKIAPEQFERIRHALFSTNLFQAPEATDCITDQPTVKIEADFGSGRRWRMVDSGCVSDRKNFWPTVELIDQIAGPREWAYPSRRSQGTAVKRAPPLPARSPPPISKYTASGWSYLVTNARIRDIDGVLARIGAIDVNLTVKALCRFFAREVPLLPSRYDWRIPAIEGFAQSGQSGYQPNLDFKLYLKEQWDAGSLDRRLSLAKVIISDWGGVRGNQSETLKGYVMSVSQAEPSMPLKGVASYSKLFAVVHPDRFAIYDARVAACLNAIQINAGLARGMAFNYVPGRNNIVGNTLKKIGFTHEPKCSVKQLVASGWHPIERDRTYAEYLKVIALCLQEMKCFSLVTLEMALFCNAERECQKALAGHVEALGTGPF